MPIELVLVPPLRVNVVAVDPDWGVSNAKDESVLCGDWLCGGALDFQAASSSRSGHTVPVAGSSVERLFASLGVRPVAPPFRQRTPIATSRLK